MNTSTTPPRILRVDASARHEGSVSRRLGDTLIQQLSSDDTTRVSHRDLAQTSLPFVTEDWITANFTDPEQRSAEQRQTLALSDTLVAELQQAEVLVLGVPIYNFGIPAALKAWIDMVARARVTFRYTENGPVGLLEGKRAYLLMASGGTPVGSDIDFASGYLRHVLGFIGIHEVQIIAADSLMQRGEDGVAEALEALQGLAA